jgi:7,8-dihydropterin-6-yl-methyl-4-(beta-D-ribofuranosyl)aminobenzene 5'-phosphate synthase
MKIKTYFFLILLLTNLVACQSPAITSEDEGLPGTVTTPAVTSQPVGIPPSLEAQSPDRVTPLPFEIQTPANAQGYDDLTITILYDNQPYDPHLDTAWGYAAWVQAGEHNLLFDTGGNGDILLNNMRAKKVNPTTIQRILISHADGDHIDGLVPLLSTGVKPEVYLLSSFPDNFKHQVSNLATLIEVRSGTSLGGEMYTTGELGRNIPEQALVIRTRRGLVVVTGCAHRGIVDIVEGIRDTYGEKVYLVMGGFHLEGKSEEEITAIIADFRRLGVEKVAPSHCTGGRAIVKFKDEYGEDFLMVGAGRVVTLDE